MPVALVQEFPIDPSGDRSTTNYDAIQARLDIANNPPDGGILRTAGFDVERGVFRIFAVWETREQAERFIAEQLQPMIENGPEAFPNPGAFTMPTREGFYELHHVVGG